MEVYPHRRPLMRNAMQGAAFLGREGGWIIDANEWHLKVVEHGPHKPAEPLWWTFLKYWDLNIDRLKGHQLWNLRTELSDLGTLDFGETREKVLDVFNSHARWTHPGSTHVQTVDYISAAQSRSELYERIVGFPSMNQPPAKLPASWKIKRVHRRD